MYAVHFLLFVTTLVLCHIIQSCLKPYAKHGETDQPPDEPQAEEASTKEDEDDCLWSPWSAWSECTVTCGDGISVRHRVTLILGNCTSDMVQEKICSEQHCPHGKDFIFQRKDEDVDQPSGNEEGEQVPEDVGQNNHQCEPTLSDAGAENPDEVPVSPDGHVTGYKNAPNENVNPENGAHFDENNEQDDDAPRGRGRGQSWTSDDGNPWGHQSSFDSLSHGEDAEEGFRSGAEEKPEDADNCFSDCSPTDPPSDSFGSKRSETEDGAHDEAKSGQDKGEGGTENGKTGEEGQGEKFGKGSGKSFEDKKKSKNDESLKDDGKISNDEDSRHDVDTDFENDDDNFDDEEMEDADEYDEDGDDNDGSGAGKKQKREHEEEDAEQDDLEQDDDEEEEAVEKKRRRKKKRKRKRKPKTKENGVKSSDSQVVCDPTEIGDTFLANIGNADSVDGHGSGLAASENEKSDYVDGLGLAAAENEKSYSLDGLGLAVSENEKSDSAGKLTSDTKVCFADKSKLEVSEIEKHDSAKNSTTDVLDSEILHDAADRL